MMYSAFQWNAFQRNAFQIVNNSIVPPPVVIPSRGGIAPEEYRRFKKRMERLDRETKRYEEEKHEDRKELDRIIRLARKIESENEEIGIESETLSEIIAESRSELDAAAMRAAVNAIAAETQRLLLQTERSFAALVRQRLVDEEIAIALLC